MSYQVIAKGTQRMKDTRRVPRQVKVEVAGRSVEVTRATLEPDGETDATYVVELADYSRLIERAYRNKNRMAVDGPIRVRIVQRRKVAP